jgi:methylenetetrahydrofolate reductase (NADPH)
VKIIDALKGQKPAFSFEFFPPKDSEGVERLFQTISELHSYEPTYVSVTYGAMGSTRGLTVELVRRIKQEVGIEAMAHLTCVGATKEEIADVLRDLQRGGIENVLPLRGDPPKGQESFVRHEGGFAHASELVKFIRDNLNHDLCLAGACYPEKHPEASSPEVDLDHLKAKVDAGADFLITQLFFDNEDYFRFVERADKAGITCPIVAGVMPITNVSQIKRFTQMCGARIPAALLSRLEGADDAAVRALGVEHATEQCRGLLKHGAPGIHFYTLNRSTATRGILENLRAEGVAPPTSSSRSYGKPPSSVAS